MDKINIQGVTGVEVLTIVFITLKLLGKITWSWFWVLSPLWISISLIGLVAIILWFIFK